MTGQRARSSVRADHRSAHPDIPGVPWWGAVLIAIAGTALGFALDAMTGSENLTAVFAGCYAAGCVVAVLAVRYSSIFTAVVQPPLILFVAIPTAYLIMSKAPLSGGKSTALTIGYPLVERFPLMISTALGVLIIGAVRWYWGMFTGKSADKAKTARPKTATKGSSKTAPKAARETKPRTPARTRAQALVGTNVKADGTKTTRTRRPVREDAPPRTRHDRQEPPPRRRSRYDSEPVARVPTGTPWENERGGRTERRPARRYRDEYQDYPEDYPDDPYDRGQRPRYREPREPLTHHPVARVRYRGEADERPIRRRRDDRYER